MHSLNHNKSFLMNLFKQKYKNFLITNQTMNSFSIFVSTREKFPKIITTYNEKTSGEVSECLMHSVPIFPKHSIM